MPSLPALGRLAISTAAQPCAFALSSTGGVHARFPCGYEYDPEVGDPDNGIAPGTAWEDVPADWVCPVCGLDKDAFVEE